MKRAIFLTSVIFLSTMLKAQLSTIIDEFFPARISWEKFSLLNG